MFVLVFLRSLAQHPRRPVVIACGVTLAAAGIAVLAAGIAARQPLAAHVGLMILLAAVAFAVFARSARHRGPDVVPGSDGAENGNGQPGA
jgi:uncharacterized membrane protein HdeD (DUF308 family)